jgi:hypothetical protein
MTRLTQDAFKQPENFEPSKRNIRFCMEKLRDLNKQIVQEDELAKVRDELQKKDAELDSINQEIETLKDEIQKNQAVQAQKNSEITAKNKKIAECEQELKRARNSLDLCNKEKGSLQDKLNAYMSKPAAVKLASPPTISFSPASSSSASSASDLVTAPANATTNKSNQDKSKMYSSTPTMIASKLNDDDEDDDDEDHDDDEKDFAPSAPPFDLAPKREQEEAEEDEVAEEEVPEEEAEVAEIFAHVDAIIKKELASGPDTEKAKCLDTFIEAVEISREFKASLLDIALKESSSNIQKGKLYFDIFTQKVFDELCFYTKYAIEINDKNRFDKYISQKATLAIHTTGIINRIFPSLFLMIEDITKYKAAKTPTLRLKILSDYQKSFKIIKSEFEDLDIFKIKSMCSFNGSGYIRYLQCLIVVIEKFKQFKIDKKIGNTERISEYFNTEKIKLTVKDDEYKLPPCSWFQDIDYYIDDFAFYKPEFLRILSGIQDECSRVVADILKEDSLIPAIDHLKFLRNNIDLHYVKFIFGCALSETDNNRFKAVSINLGKYIIGVKVFFEPPSTSDVSVQKLKTDKEIEYFEELNKLKDACDIVNKFVQPSSQESLKKTQEIEIKKAQEIEIKKAQTQSKSEAKSEAKSEVDPEVKKERRKILNNVGKVIQSYAAKNGKKEQEKAICLHNFIEKGATMVGEIIKPRVMSLALDSSIIGGGEDIDFDKFMENAYDKLCFYTPDFAFINLSKDYVAQKANAFINPTVTIPRFFEDFDEANKISQSLTGKSEEERDRILNEYDSGTFGSLEYALEQPRELKTDYMCEDNGVGYYKYLWQLIAVIQQMPSIMKNYPPNKEGNITISDYFKEKIMEAKVGDMVLPTCVWFDDIDRYTKISVRFEPKFQRMIQQIQQECSYNSSNVLKEANLEAKIETINSLITEIEDYTVDFVFGCALNDENNNLFKQSYATLFKYYMNVKKSFDSTPAAAPDISGAQQKYIDRLDLLNKFFIIVVKFVKPVAPAEIAKAMEEMSKGGKGRNKKHSLRKTKKIRKTVKRVRKTKRKGKK